MTYVEKLQGWYEKERAAGRVVDIKFFPHYLTVPGHEPVKLFEGPDPTQEQLAEAAYKLLTGETPSEELNTSEL